MLRFRPMEASLVLAASSLAVLAGLFVATGLAGRASGEVPTCSRCRRDVRDAVLARRACACGADITAPAAIRLRGAKRSLGRAAIGVCCAFCAVALLLFGLHNARAGLRAVDHAPLWALTTGLASSAEWARASLARQLRTGDIDRTSAPRVVAAVLRGIDAAERVDTAPLRLGLAARELAFLLPSEDALVEPLVRRTELARFALAEKRPVRPGEEITLRMEATMQSMREVDLRFHRIEEVSIDGQAIAWRLSDATQPRPAWAERIVQLSDDLLVTLPEGLATGERRVTIAVVSGWCDLPIESVASAGAVPAWNAGVRSARQEFVVTITVTNSVEGGR